MRNILLILIMTFVMTAAKAGEGMWLPQLLKALNEGEMQSMGMKMTAEDIYSVNQGSLKDAIAHFGGYCTSELISGQGLLLTNHHCGYGEIQARSTIEDNYLKDGFWANSIDDELPNPGLFAKFIVRIDDVTDGVLKGVKESMTSAERQSIVDMNITGIKALYRLKKFQNIEVKPFYHGNQYFLFVTETFHDVRLVGTPPESIGKFGADTDNWVFPRHTGDFALFRIYANQNNEPAEYAEDNVPYQPKHFLPISLDGVEEGDFTMIFGFPGRTSQYLPSEAIRQVRDVLDPTKIAVRQIALDIMGKHMRSDEHIRLQYSSKFARIANGWKKWIGEKLGLTKSGAVERKKALEEDFLKKSNNKYSSLLKEFNDLYTEIEPYAKARDLYSEVARRNVELLATMSRVQRLVNAFEKNGEEAYQKELSSLKKRLESFYKNYRFHIDKEVFVALMEHYVTHADSNNIPNSLEKDGMFLKGIKGYDELFESSSFKTIDEASVILNALPENAISRIKKDPIYQLYNEFVEKYRSNVSPNYNQLKTQIDSIQRIYMAALMETFPDKRFYPDANSTMRVTYGQVNGYHPRDAVYYEPVSYFDGVIEKYVPGDYEFDVDEKLLELYETKDYGQYADKNGKVPVCFIGSNHTTGGNSGSPAIDAHGNLVGLNFDRVWEGTMSDLNYDPSICRNIMVDARYILFIVDKYAGATRLIDEMNLVHPKMK